MSAQERSGKQTPAKAKMCKLKKDGMIEEIDKLSARPIVICNKCRAEADSPTHLCNPRALKPKK